VSKTTASVLTERAEKNERSITGWNSLKA